MLTCRRERGGQKGRFGSNVVRNLLPTEGYLTKIEERDKTRKTRICMRGKNMTQGEFSDRINKVIIASEQKIQVKTASLRASDKLPIGNDLTAISRCTTTLTTITRRTQRTKSTAPGGKKFNVRDRMKRNILVHLIVRRCLMFW